MDAITPNDVSIPWFFSRRSRRDCYLVGDILTLWNVDIPNYSLSLVNVKSVIPLWVLVIGCCYLFHCFPPFLEFGLRGCLRTGFFALPQGILSSHLFAKPQNRHPSLTHQGFGLSRYLWIWGFFKKMHLTLLTLPRNVTFLYCNLSKSLDVFLNLTQSPVQFSPS